jgi:hypothetical protein
VPIFNFALRPLDDVQPSRGRSGLVLTWSDLSDGWFWLALGGQELLRIAGEPVEGDLPYLDEQVARLWENLVAILPAVLAPIPDDLSPVLAQPKAWNALLERARAIPDEADRVASALGFWRERRLDATSVAGAPELHLWRCGETIHASWSTPKKSAGDADWVRVEGHASMPYADFLLQVRAFDTAFLALMKERIDQLGLGVLKDLPDNVAVDLTRLTYDQSERSLTLDAALEKRAASIDWAEVRWMLRRALPQ